MKILAIEKENPGLTAKDFEPHLECESKMVWELYAKGIIREIYFGEENHTAHIIMECGDKDKAKRILDKLPLVKNNLIRFELTTLVPYTGFKRLFNE